MKRSESEPDGEYQVVPMKISKNIKICDTSMPFIEEMPFKARFLHVFIMPNSAANCNNLELINFVNIQLVFLQQNEHYQIDDVWAKTNLNTTITSNEVYVASAMCMMKELRILLRERSKESSAHQRWMEELDSMTRELSSEDEISYEYEEEFLGHEVCGSSEEEESVK